MPIRGPFVIPRQGWFYWRLQRLYWPVLWNQRFPGAACKHNRKPIPKRKPKRS